MSAELIKVKTPACWHCHQTSTMELTVEEVLRWEMGAHVQDALPTRSAAERELLKTGVHDTCWTAMLGEEED